MAIDTSKYRAKGKNWAETVMDQCVRSGILNYEEDDDAMSKAGEIGKALTKGVFDGLMDYFPVDAYFGVSEYHSIMESAEATQPSEKRLYEASGNVDKLYATLDKAKSMVEKAVNAVLDAAEVMDDVLVEATAIGGKVADIIPGHVESIMATLTDVAEHKLQALVEGNGQSSLESLKDLVGSIPYRDLRPETKEEKIGRITMRPDLSNGPRSAVLGGGEPQQPAMHESVESNVLSFEALRESEEFGQDLNDEYDDFRELNAGLAGNGPSYVSPIEKMNFFDKSERLVDDSALSDDPLEGADGELSMDNINIPRMSDGISFDCIGAGGEDMMGEMLSSGVNDMYEEQGPIPKM